MTDLRWLIWVNELKGGTAPCDEIRAVPANDLKLPLPLPKQQLWSAT